MAIRGGSDGCIRVEHCPVETLAQQHATKAGVPPHPGVTFGGSNRLQRA